MQDHTMRDTLEKLLDKHFRAQAALIHWLADNPMPDDSPTVRTVPFILLMKLLDAGIALHELRGGKLPDDAA